MIGTGVEAAAPDALSRRTLLAGATALAAMPAHALVSDPGATRSINEAAQRFLARADASARFALSGQEPTRWHWTNVQRFSRNGQVFSDMDAA